MISPDRAPHNATIIMIPDCKLLYYKIAHYLYYQIALYHQIGPLRTSLSILYYQTTRQCTHVVPGLEMWNLFVIIIIT